MNIVPPATSGTASETLGEQVYGVLRKRLLGGEWLPGTRLTLRRLAQELGTSVQPVREAIARLSAERVLVMKPNSSVMLPPVERAVLDEIWSIRILLESEAARLCALRLTPSDDADLDRAAAATLRSLTASNSHIERVSMIQNLAVLLGRLSGSTLLAGQIETLRLRSAPHYAAALRADIAGEAEFIRFTLRMQAELVDALKRRDAANAYRLRGADLYTFQRFIYRQLGLE